MDDDAQMMVIGGLLMVVAFLAWAAAPSLRAPPSGTDGALAQEAGLVVAEIESLLVEVCEGSDLAAETAQLLRSLDHTAANLAAHGYGFMVADLDADTVPDAQCVAQDGGAVAFVLSDGSSALTQTVSLP